MKNEFKRVIFISLGALLFTPTYGAAQDYVPAYSSTTWQSFKRSFGHEEWFRCQNDGQCTIIASHGCGFLLPINKGYYEEANKSDEVMHPSCLSHQTWPIDTKTRCINNECLLVIPNEDEAAAIFLKRGLALFEKNDFKAAQQNFKELILSYPHSPNASEGVFYNAECYFKLGKPQQAAAAYRTYYSVYPEGVHVAAAKRREAQCQKQ